MLDKTLVKGDLIKRCTFKNWSDYNSYKKCLTISISCNTLTIFCDSIDTKLINLNLLGRLWSGMILKLEKFWWSSIEGIITLLKLVINWDKTSKGWKLLFSKIEFVKTDFDWYLQNDSRYYKKFLKYANRMYDLSFEDKRFNDIVSKFDTQK